MLVETAALYQPSDERGGDQHGTTLAVRGRARGASSPLATPPPDSHPWDRTRAPPPRKAMRRPPRNLKLALIGLALALEREAYLSDDAANAREVFLCTDEDAADVLAEELPAQ